MDKPNGIEFKKVKGEYNQWTVTGRLSAGMILSIKNALEATGSPVGMDTLHLVNRAIDGNAELKTFIDGNGGK